MLELLSDCPGLRSLTAARQPAAFALLRAGPAEALPPLRTLALGSCTQASPSATLDLLAAPALAGLRSLSLDIAATHHALEEALARRARRRGLPRGLGAQRAAGRPQHGRGPREPHE